MCVIVYSPKNKALPTEEQLGRMWATNPDGAGFAYVDHNKVIYRKGFMTLADLKQAIAPLAEKLTRTSVAFHFRIGTSGNNDARTCHPFPLSTSYGDLTRTEGKTNAVLFHNGIIGQGGLIDPLSSDTQDFVSALTPLLKKRNKSKARSYFIEQLIDGNRLLIMRRDGVEMYGNWEKDGDLFVSNLNYKTNYYTNADWYRHYYKQNVWEWEDEAERYKAEQEEAEAEATALWEEIDAKQYRFVSVHELSVLRKNADDWTTDELIKNGKCYYYDKEQMLVWYEYNTYNSKGV